MKNAGKFIHVLFLVIVILFVQCQSEMEPFIVNGAMANIRDFPHSVFMYIKCGSISFVCGGSILNQVTVLTAAHCLDETGCKISVNVGSEHSSGLQHTVASAYRAHPRYNGANFSNDVCLVSLWRSIQFGVNVKRVVLLNKIDFSRVGYVAGWGLVNEETFDSTNYLKYAKQKLYTRPQCLKYIDIPEGAICGSPVAKGTGYAAQGDSGSALIINDYVQIGLVSFKIPDTSVDLVAFTDISYHLDWIVDAANQLYCKINLK